MSPNHSAAVIIVSQKKQLTGIWQGHHVAFAAWPMKTSLNRMSHCLRHEGPVCQTKLCGLA